MSKSITLSMLRDAVAATIPDADTAEQGQMLADLIVKFDAELSAPAPTAVKPKADPEVGNGSAMRMTLAGKMMPVAEGTITPAQTKRISDNYDRKVIVKTAHKLGFAGKTLKTLSMADASDLYSTLRVA
jgi:hypothetical protein